MKTAPSLCVLATAALLSSHAHALDAKAFYRCAMKEFVVYQDTACLTGIQTMVQIVVPTFGESGWKPVLYAQPTAEAAGTGSKTAVKIVVLTATESPRKSVQSARPTVEATEKDDLLVSIRVPVIVTAPPQE